MKQFLILFILLSTLSLYSNNNFSLKYHPKYFKFRINKTKSQNFKISQGLIGKRKPNLVYNPYRKVKLSNAIITGAVIMYVAKGLINVSSGFGWNNKNIIYPVIGGSVGLISAASINYLDGVGYGKDQLNKN